MTEAQIVERIDGRRERLHVSLGTVCNNNCLFCVEDNREDRRIANAAMTPERVRRILEAHRGAEEICFTSGEPTTRSDLPRLISWARELGYPTVSLMTNGRRLSYEPYARGLADAGLTRICISIHGHTERLHDGLTRTPGSFAQTEAGLRNAAGLRPRGVALHTSTVVTSRNLPHLREIYQWLRALGVDQVVFNVMQPTGRARVHFERLFPSYGDIVRTFGQLLDQAAESRPMAFLVDVPLCTSEGLPDFNRGYVERQCHYEALVRPEDRAVREAPADANASAGAGEAASTGMARPTALPLVLVTRDDVDRAARSKRSECGSCRYEPACEGVWRTYSEARGWAEFVPVMGR